MLNNVQVLRAFAALGVVLVHESAFNPPLLDRWLAFGLYGVDVFFVISGFVMMYTIDRRPITPPSFFLNRIIRIAPLYWAMTMAIFLVALFFPNLLKATSSSVSEFVLSIMFIPFRKEGGLIQPTLFPGWTLNYEMFFYALIATSLFLRSAALRMWIVLAILCGLAIIGAVSAPTSAAGEFYTSSIVLEFGYGMLIGRAFPRIETMGAPAWTGGVLVIVGATLLVLLPTYGPIGNRASMLGIPAALLVLGAIQLEVRGIRVTSPALLLMGSASYAVYLVHPFMLAAVQLVVARAGILTGPWSLAIVLLSGLLVTLAAGIAVHLGFERPVDRFLRRQLPFMQRSAPGLRETLALWPWRRRG